jgi:enoyl-CoA hydratase/carnithine racemase
MLLRRWPLAAVQQAMREEAAAFAQLLHGPEAREAMAAFIEKRPPDFSKLPHPAAA